MKRLSGAVKPAILWVLATVVASGLSVIPGNLAGEIPYMIIPSSGGFYARFYPISLPTIAIFLTVGAVFSAVQWIVLRKLALRAWVWIPITAITFPLTVQAFDLLGPPRLGAWILFLIPVSVVQWLYLRHHFPRSPSWIWSHSLMAIALFLMAQFPSSSEVDCCVSLSEMLTGGVFVGALFGLPGSISLLIMLAQPQEGQFGAA